MREQSRPNTRRRALLGSLAATVGGCWASPARSQGGKSASGGALAVCQIVDMSPAQQDVSKDFLVGSRAAWQEINSKGGLRGRKIQHLALETDGTPAGLRAALNSARDNPACLALSGSAGDPLAQALAQLLAAEGLALAHLAPWLQTSAYDTDGRTLPVFASRLEQIQFALQSLSVMGMTEIGAVYAGATELALQRDEVDRSSDALKLRVRHFHATGDLSGLGRSLAPGTPAVLLFFGGTPELVQFSQGLESQARQRYVVAMADVNLQTLMQMGAARRTPVIATQIVPVVNANLAVVRAYRDSLARFFDEPPTPISLAGYIAARTSLELLSSVEGGLTRASVLAASQRAISLDIGGFRVSTSGQKRTSSYVTQSMLTADGRVLG